MSCTAFPWLTTKNRFFVYNNFSPENYLLRYFVRLPSIFSHSWLTAFNWSPVYNNILFYFHGRTENIYKLILSSARAHQLYAVFRHIYNQYTINLKTLFVSKIIIQWFGFYQVTGFGTHFVHRLWLKIFSVPRYFFETLGQESTTLPT